MVVIILLTYSCQKQDGFCKKRIKDKSQLFGSWEERLDTSTLYFSYASWDFTFLKPDSFQVTIPSFTDAINPYDTCKQGSWTEYAAGRFALDKKEIRLSGVYTDSIFIKKEVGCHRIGPFKLTSEVFICEDQLGLQYVTSSGHEETRNLFRIK